MFLNESVYSVLWVRNVFSLNLEIFLSNRKVILSLNAFLKNPPSMVCRHCFYRLCVFRSILEFHNGTTQASSLLSAHYYRVTSPTHCQVIAGQCNMASSLGATRREQPEGQPGRRPSRWAECRGAAEGFPFSHCPPLSPQH